MALIAKSTVQIRQKQTTRLTYKMWMGLNLLRMPIKDLHEELRRQVDTNPALADCKFELPPGWRPQTAASLSGDNAFLLDSLAAEESLYGHLCKELDYSGVDGALKEKAIEVIGNLDENGRYDGGELDEEGEKARQLVMTLDPLGCGAKSLAECYMAQIGKIPKADRGKATELIGKLDDILAGRAELTMEMRVLAAKLLACLDAKPGSHYTSGNPEYIVADVIVDKEGRVTVEHGTIPEIRVSPKYANMAADGELDEATREYAQEMVQHVKELQNAIAKRFETLETIAKAIVERQRDFILGQGEMRPLKMKDIAQVAKCAYSTVSRTAERKYMRCPRGLVKFRDFFAVKDTSAVEHLKRLLKDPETAKLSDMKISRLMQADGFKFARRTVNKYRRILKP